MITKNILLSTLLAAGFALPAVAATTSPQAASSQGSDSPAQTSAAHPTGPQIAARLRKSLSDAGFTDIRIMPQSFLVHAKDKDGDPVMMVVNPDSITTVTAMSNGGNTGTASSQPGTPSSGAGTKTTQPKTSSD